MKFIQDFHNNGGQPSLRRPYSMTIKWAIEKVKELNLFEEKTSSKTNEYNRSTDFKVLIRTYGDFLIALLPTVVRYKGAATAIYLIDKSLM